MVNQKNIYLTQKEGTNGGIEKHIRCTENTKIRDVNSTSSITITNVNTLLVSYYDTLLKKLKTLETMDKIYEGNFLTKVPLGGKFKVQGTQQYH